MDTPEGPSLKRRKSCTSRVYEAICIFCQKQNKYLKRDRSREPLIQCCELRSDASIRTAALQKNDGRILALASRELVAAEAHYHRSCYREYTRICNRRTNTTNSNPVDSNEQHKSYQIAEERSYQLLFNFLRMEIIGRPKVIYLTEITERLVQFMNENGVDSIKESTKKHIRRKLLNEFGELLSFLSNENGRVIVIPQTMTMQQLAEENLKLKAELQTFHAKSSPDGMILQASQFLRAQIKNIKPYISWPPKPWELTSDSVQLPEMLQKFLNSLLTGQQTTEEISSRTQCQTNSIGQDIIYNVTNGKVQTPKHILLPYAVKSLTGNVELIHMLNRLGYGVSYSQMVEIDTALCLEKLALGQHCPLPENIHPNTFTVLAWDNIDRQEETITGEGTSHRVNGIAVQPKTFGPHLLTNTPKVEKKKQRSIEATPYTLPVYNSGERVGPINIQTGDSDFSSIRKHAWRKNLIGILNRLVCRAFEQTTCGWTGFNISVRDGVFVSEDNVGYLPTINSPATDLATVQEILIQSLSVMKALFLDKIVVVFDQALYAKAAEIVWKHREKYQKVILRLGVFHTIGTMLSIIGKRFQDAGLKDLCIEANLVAEGSVARVLEGRQYNRAVRVHKIMYEELLRLAWKGFLIWIDSKEVVEQQKVHKGLQAIQEFEGDICQKNFECILQDPVFAELSDAFSDYLEFLRSKSGNLSNFWMSYVDLVEILLSLIRSSREGNWQLHLSSIRALVPWCFAYDKQNYARYLSVYFAQMSNLENDHPDVYENFRDGGFSVQLGSQNPFSRIPVDQTVEETVNRDTQTAGGTKGFSLNPRAVKRYYLAAEFRCRFLRQFRDMVRLNNAKFSHKDLQQTRIKKDEADVMKVVRLLEKDWINPFQNEQFELLSLSTGTLATPEISNDLCNAHCIGENAYNKFKVERLESNDPAKKFHDKLPRNNLKTFSNINKKTKTVKAGGAEVVLRADRNLFARMILIAESRKLSMKNVLAHPLGPVPWSLATSDGSLRKTTKSSLAKELQKLISPAETIPYPSACIIDGMSIVQKIKGDHKTFSDIANSIFCCILNEGRESDRIDIVFDTYRSESIKTAERNYRGFDAGGVLFKNIAPGHKVKQWRRFLSVSENKTNLIKFLVNEWRQTKYQEKMSAKIMYVTCEEICYKLTPPGIGQVQELQSSHEEADTRIFLHANHASKSGYKAIVVISEDTDVLVLSLFATYKIQTPIYQKCGSRSRSVYTDVSKVASSLGKDVCNALIGLHAFTGCDTVSAFAGRGKIAALKIIKTESKFQEVFNHLGQEWQISSDLIQSIETFTCLMYGCQKEKLPTNINEFRYQLFCTKHGELDSYQLPPCADSLKKHIQRANYQAAIWRRCLERTPGVPRPNGYGWNFDSDRLVIDWMDGPTAPVAVLQLLSCNCSRSCQQPNCLCLANGLKCTNICRLKDCNNQNTELDDEITNLDNCLEDEFEDEDENADDN